MNVYIIRHGKSGHDAPSDRQRVLAGRGKRQAAFLGERLAALDSPPEAIFTSAYPRAFETASIIAAALGLEPEIDDRLICGAPASHAVELIGELAARGLDACLVGHNPQLSHLASVLANGPGGASAGLRTGELIGLSFEDGEPVGRSVPVMRVRLDEEGGQI